MAVRYKIHASGVIIETLRQIQRTAAHQGRGEIVLAALRNLYERLKQDPLEVGEALYELPALQLQVRTAIVRPVVLDFAVSA